MQVRITETFLSLQGESSFTGLPTFFIRLTGCPLRCQYCDTEYAFNGGKMESIDALVQLAKQANTKNVCVTGGEPLAQPECLSLLSALCYEGFTVSLETSGAMDITEVDPRVIKIVDIKTPASKEQEKNRWSNLEALSESDQLKFVICDRADYDWSRSKLIEYNLSEKVSEVLFSPSAEQLPAEQLANWVVEDHLPVRFQVQLHKILWGNKQGV